MSSESTPRLTDLEDDDGLRNCLDLRAAAGAVGQAGGASSSEFSTSNTDAILPDRAGNTLLEEWEEDEACLRDREEVVLDVVKDDEGSFFRSITAPLFVSCL